MEKIKFYIKRNLLYILGVIIGGTGGYLYYVYIGCESGSCPITSSPYMSIIWGAVLGSLIGGMFKKQSK